MALLGHTRWRRPRRNHSRSAIWVSDPAVLHFPAGTRTVLAALARVYDFLVRIPPGKLLACHGVEEPKIAPGSALRSGLSDISLFAYSMMSGNLSSALGKGFPESRLTTSIIGLLSPLAISPLDLTMKSACSSPPFFPIACRSFRRVPAAVSPQLAIANL